MIKSFLSRCDVAGKRLITINARLGLTDGSVQTLQSIGDSLNLTRERIRQFQADVIHILNRPENTALLTPFWDSVRKAVKANNDQMDLENLWIVLRYKFHWKDEYPAVILAQFLKMNRQFEIICNVSKKTVTVKLR